MERNPHAVVEGLALAAYAVGATEAFIAVRADYTLAIERLTAAIRSAEEVGYLGTDALGAGFDLHMAVRPLQGGFVLGEETVLLRALENRRGMPEQRPPYPAMKGLWGEPTVVNNVETLAAVPWIIANGANAYRSLHGGDVTGTTLVQLSGAIARPGVAEVPLGLPLGEVLDTVGGGLRAGRVVRAVLVGGPSGGFLPVEALGTAYSYGPVESAGAIMGSGSILLADQSTCLVDLATLMTRFLADEACGKTIPCRIGTRRMMEIAERFTSGRPRPTDTQLLRDLSSDIMDGALCALEYTAPNPLLTGMRYFGPEFEDHIVRSDCPAGVCRPLRVATGSLS
jgi:NADH:ubiquinone oxidoreductase subunit F (NADH-binding)